MAQCLSSLFLVASKGLIAALAFALVKIGATQVNRLVGEGKIPAGLVEEATDKPDAYFRSNWLGITILPLGLGWIGDTALR